MLLDKEKVNKPIREVTEILNQKIQEDKMETWVNVSELSDKYQISNTEKLRTINGKLIKPIIDKSGHAIFYTSINKKRYRIDITNLKKVKFDNEELEAVTTIKKAEKVKPVCKKESNPFTERLLDITTNWDSKTAASIKSALSKMAYEPVKTMDYGKLKDMLTNATLKAVSETLNNVFSELRGDSEEWSIIEGSKGNAYEISTYGNVRRKTLKGYITVDGYANGEWVQFSRYGKRFAASKASLVLETFVCPNKEGKREVIFKDGNRKNCKLSNLAWR